MPQVAHRDARCTRADDGADHHLQFDDRLRLVDAIAGKAGVVADPAGQEHVEVVGAGAGDGAIERLERTIGSDPGSERLGGGTHATPIRTSRTSVGAAPWERKPHSFGSPLPHGIPKIRNSSGPATASTEPQNCGVTPP